MNRSRCTLAMTEAAATDADRRSARTAQRTGCGQIALYLIPGHYGGRDRRGRITERKLLHVAP